MAANGVSSLICDAVDQFYGSEPSIEDDLAAMCRAFDTCNCHDLDGASWVDRLRSGSRLKSCRS